MPTTNVRTRSSVRSSTMRPRLRRRTTDTYKSSHPGHRCPSRIPREGARGRADGEPNELHRAHGLAGIDGAERHGFPGELWRRRLGHLGASSCAIAGTFAIPRAIAIAGPIAVARPEPRGADLD